MSLMLGSHGTKAPILDLPPQFGKYSLLMVLVAWERYEHSIWRDRVLGTQTNDPTSGRI